MKFKAKIKSGLQTLKLKLAGGQKKNTSRKEWTSPEIKQNAPLKETYSNEELQASTKGGAKAEVFPEYHRNSTVNPDKSVTFTIDGKQHRLSADDVKQLEALDRGSPLSGHAPISPELKAFRDTEAVKMAVVGKDKENILPGIESQDQLDIYNEQISAEEKAKGEEIIRMTKEAQAKAQSPTELTRAIDRESGAREGFLTASVIGSTGAVGVGLGGLKAIGAGKALTSSAAAVPVMAATALLGLGKGEMAFRSKTRASDVSDAASAMIDSDKAMKKIMIAAKDPNSDMSQLIQAREDIKEYKYQAYKLAFEESYYDAKWGLSEGRQTILDYESWKGPLEDIEDEQFNSRLMAQNRDEYVNEMSAYLASEGNQ